MLKTFDAELKLVIAGNHDLDLDGHSWAKNCAEYGDDPTQHEAVISLVKGPPAIDAGVTYLEEGTSTFTLSGNQIFIIYTSPYKPNYSDLVFPYERNEDKFNNPQQVAEGALSIAEHPIRAHVDIVMTHSPPTGVLDKCPHGELGCENLLHAIRRVRPLMHCFRHS